MILGQSAATAAAFAIDAEIPVQQVPYAKLRAQLLTDGQMLSWGDSGGEPAITLDNSETTGVTIAGDWSASSSVGGFIGANYCHDGNTGKGSKSVRFTPSLASAGSYQVSLRWTSDPNRATNVPVDIVHTGGTTTTTLNQQTQGGQWVPLGTFDFAVGSLGSVTLRTTATNGYVIADAARFQRVSTSPSVSLWPMNAIAAEPLSANVLSRPAQIRVSRTGALTSSLEVEIAVSGSATEGADYKALGSTLTIPGGAAFTSAEVVPQLDALSEGSEPVIVQLQPSPAYTLTTLSSATIRILDRPFDAWRHRRFTAAQRADESVSGDNADPDHDGHSNLLEWMSNNDPLSSDAGPQLLTSRGSSGSPETLALRFSRNKDADLLVRPEVSEDLVTWREGSAWIDQVVVDDDGMLQTVLARNRQQTTGADQRFFRLRVDRIQ